MKQKVKCGAYARSTGNPCQAKALTNGRCKNHGGMSTGPKTPEGRQAIAQATRQRMALGEQERVLAGFCRWLQGGGREMLSRLAKNREKRKRWEKRMLEETHALRTRALPRHGVIRLLRQTFKTNIAGARHGVFRVVELSQVLLAEPVVISY